MPKLRVLQITDTLNPGGQERVAVNFFNLLQQKGVQSYICTTRTKGLLVNNLQGKREPFCLGRKKRIEVKALFSLIKYIQEHQIDILHVHGTSLFIGVLASFFPPYPTVIWHDHFGGEPINPRPRWLYWFATRFVKGVISVSEPLSEWARDRLHVPAEKVWYVPNFIQSREKKEDISATLPGFPGQRITCVANLRREKDIFTLLDAMQLVVRKNPDAHLLLVGKEKKSEYLQELQQRTVALGLKDHVSFLGETDNVSRILKDSDVGVLSSIVEGFPLVLLEYGMAGLPVVATRVGQCPEILDEGLAGILVPSKAPEQLAQALLSLLESPSTCQELGQRLRSRVMQMYNPDQIVAKVLQVYSQSLNPQRI